MFFPRLRRSTKPVFIALAVIFAVSFVFLGVGSGSTGLGDLLQGNFSLFGIHLGGYVGGILGISWAVYSVRHERRFATRAAPP